MTPPITFQEAQQAVAERYGLPDWATVIYEDCAHTPDIDKLQEESAELMAKSWANYYTQKDRGRISDRLTLSMPNSTGFNYVQKVVLSESLPFPEEI